MSEIHALTGAYAVDAIDEMERARFERHLAECEDCRTEVESLREAATLLSHEAAVAPPAGLRDRVLAEIATARPLPPLVTATTPERRRGLRWLPLLVAASVLAVLGVGAGLWQPWRDSAPPPSAAEKVLQAADAASVAVVLPGGAKATLVRSVSQGRAVLRTEKMPPAPGGKVYELWLQQPDGSMEPAGLMPPVADQTVLLDGDAATAIAAGITVEPAGGSDQPTSDPIALFDFTEAT